MAQDTIHIPSVVQIEIHHQCNRKCSYCPNSNHTRTPGNMSLENYEKILNQLKELDFVGRVSNEFYNEPTLNKNLISYVRLTKKILPNCQYHLYSNGTLLNINLFESLLDAGVDRFIITRHEQDLNSTEYKFNETYLNLTADQKLKVIYRTPDLIKLHNRGGLLPQLGSIGLKLSICQIPLNIVVIMSNGDVIGCLDDYNENLKMGNVFNQSFKSIIQSPRYTQFQLDLKRGLRHKYSPCDKCNRTEVMGPFF